MRRVWWAIAFAAAVLMAFGCGNRQDAREPDSEETNHANAQQANQGRDLPTPGRPLVGDKPPIPSQQRIPEPRGIRVQTFVSGLQVPWDIAFASMDRIYVTERPGRVRLIENGRLRPQPYATIDAAARGEGGLMGIALHPDYPNPRWVYVMYSYGPTGQPRVRVSRFTDTGSRLQDERTMVGDIPGALYHNGGIIRFGPDGMLYIGTGDAGEPELAQNRSSLAGKILRVTPEGGVPGDNPFGGSPVYAYGLRNVQGLAWNPESGDLWATNHGPSGEFGLRAMDSVYIIQRGGNHGWPRVLGVTDVRGVVDPILFYPQDAVPPALAAFWRGDFFFASLRGEHLQRVVLSAPRTVNRVERWFQTGTYQGRFGRLRAVVTGPDGALYVSTSNRDGRGRARSGDDRILRISAE